MKLTRTNTPFILIGKMADGTEWRDTRASMLYLPNALDNWFNNPMLEHVSHGEHATVYLWPQDLHNAEMQNKLLKKHGFVFFADITPLADKHNARVDAFISGYKKLIADTGFFVGVDCHAVEPMLCEAHKPAAMADALGFLTIKE